MSHDAVTFVMAGLPGQVPGTKFHQDTIHNSSRRRLLYTLPDASGRGMYIEQNGTAVMAGNYEHASHHPTDAMFQPPQHGMACVTLEGAAAHVANVAGALSHGGWGLLQVLEAAYPRVSS